MGGLVLGERIPNPRSELVEGLLSPGVRVHPTEFQGPGQQLLGAGWPGQVGMAGKLHAGYLTWFRIPGLGFRVYSLGSRV